MNKKVMLLSLIFAASYNVMLQAMDAENPHITPQIRALSEFVKQDKAEYVAMFTDVNRINDEFNKALAAAYPGGNGAFLDNKLGNPTNPTEAQMKAIEDADPKFKLKELYAEFLKNWGIAYEKVDKRNQERAKLVKDASGYMGVGGEEPGIGLPNNLKVRDSDGAIVPLNA